MTLASFKKLLVAGVKGSLTGLGITLLPLFDIVLSQNDATFGSNDTMATDRFEGSAVFSATAKLSHNIVSQFAIHFRNDSNRLSFLFA